MPELRLVFLFLLLHWPLPSAWGAAAGTWEDYQAKFISTDGRVIDTGREDISHSESQGYGLLLALRYGDKACFESIRRWTGNNLNVRKDGLLAWSWGERPDGVWRVLDYNNATDGDLLVAWALVAAAKQWQRDDYRQQGQTLAGEIQQLLSIQLQGEVVLLPGYYGFKLQERVVLSPAYWVFPAFEALAEEGDRPFWDRVKGSALALLEKSYTGPLNLPPDWMLWHNGELTIFKEKSELFGYESIRVPLYLSLADMKTAAKAFNPYLQWIARSNYLPVSVDLVRDQVALAQGSAGFYAVMGRCADMVGNSKLSRTLYDIAKKKIRTTPQDYYAYTLYLLAQPGEIP